MTRSLIETDFLNSYVIKVIVQDVCHSDINVNEILPTFTLTDLVIVV